MHAEARFDVGYYWTPHVKTEVGVGFLNTWEDYSFETFPVPSGRGGNFVFTNNSLRMVVVTPTFTYQFFENQFAHPYISVGARIGLLDTHSTRYPQTFTQNSVTYTAPCSGPHRLVRLRPAGGRRRLQVVLQRADVPPH